MDVAADLGSLWLEREERGTVAGQGAADATPEGGTIVPSAPAVDVNRRPTGRDFRFLAAVLLAASAPFWAFLWGRFFLVDGDWKAATTRQIERLGVEKRELSREVARLKAALDRAQAGRAEAERSLAEQAEPRLENQPKAAAEASPLTWLVGTVVGLLAVLVVVSLALR